MSDSPFPSGHLSPGEVAALLDRTLPENRRATVEAHLAECAECRRELREVHGMLGGGRQRRWAAVAVLAASAAVLVLAIGLPRREPDSTVLRTGTGAQTLELVAPAAAATVPTDSLQFIWRSAGSGARYQLNLTELTGEPVWSAGSSDTTLRLAPGSNAVKGRTYFWFVEARLPDGSFVAGAPRRVTLAP